MKRFRLTISLLTMLFPLMVNAGNNYVDLGLPSGLLWATCNLGASAPEEVGNYYAWGETSPKTFFSEDNYKYKDSPIGLTNISGTQYDAATAALGNTWRMPTKEEFEELTGNCSRTQTTRNGIICMELTGPNGNKLIIARSGFGEQGTTHEDGYGLWSSTKNGSSTAFRAWEWTYISYSYTWQGIPIRPVTSEIPTEESPDIIINEENFPDEYFRAFLKEQPYGKDGILTEEEINSITMINIRNKNIKSLKGVEFFTLLDSLVCSFNQLTSLDVSKNMALTLLHCNHNQLASLDVSKNTALTRLNCYHNQLTSIDVSKNTVLTSLNCNENQLTSLDVSTNTALTSLNCNVNQLTSLDVSKNTALTELGCGGNQLTSLDVSKNIALTNLNCYNNQLTSLDVSKNIALTGLNCYNNQLTSLDVSKNTALTSLNCNENQLTSLNVSGCTALTTLNCSDNQLTSIDVSGCKALTSLNCNDNQLTGLDVSGCKALTSLICNDNQLTGLDVSGCTALTSLNCNDNQLTGLDVSGCTALTTLNCSDNQIKGAKMDALVSTLPIQNQAKLYIINPSSAQEGNICTKDQVNIARKRGWRVYKSTGGYYDGSESEDHIIIKINEENFPDEKFREYLMNEPYGKDGVLTEEEISGITTLNVSNMGISDLKGIEYFTALKKLLCYKNNLTCLNLSANVQLNEVDCYSNQIMGIKMDSLLASLPTLSEGEGSLYVLDATDEGNICFTEQVSYAKSKGWIVYHYTGSDWQEYEGRESGIIINEDNFPDEEFRAFLIKQDYGKDLIITGDELTTIVSIDTQSYNYAWTASNGNIRTLKGIEYFTYLRYLNIAGNKIESLDISKNRQLQELDCTYNYLTELDVSQNTELTKLYCSGSFSKLDVSKNTKLTTLSFASMKLTEIDLSNNTALTDLSFDVTGLQSVDLSKNVALTKLSCIQNSSLTNLDVSKNKALTYLRCSESKLSTIDISKNTALTYLFCAYNQLTSLDVSKNGELTELACMGNQLTKLDVSKNLKLKTLKCQQNKINGERMYQLIESLPIQTSATLCVINLQVADENICTKDQVKKANEKGWKVMWGYEYYNSGPAGYHPHYYDYEGSDSEDVYIDEGNFPDDNFRAFLLEQSYGKDGVITAEERNNIKTLRVDQRRISSLKGIEYFTKLTKLDCHSNNITTLDISKNVELISLECFYNKLTSLDVSKNTELVSLYCYNNQLANLDISNNTALANLYSSYNQLTSLDVSKNTALTYLSIEGNQIVNIDISNNVALTYLYCAYNQLGSLDISNNTALAGLSCYSNQLTNLNVSKNTALSWLYCFDNQMTSLDVSNNIELKELYCSNNRLNGIDFSNNAALLWLDCSNNQLTSLDVSNNTSLKELYCNNNQLTSIDFSNNTALTKLNIYSNRIRVDEMQALVNSLPVQTDAQLGVVSLSDESEGNVCTTVQVAIAKEKGWRVMATRDFGNVNYEGSDPSGIQGITLEKNPNAPIYDLNGRRLTEPQKGINIIGGKKILNH